MQLEAKTFEEAAKDIQFFRRYKPYQYSGKWFLCILNGEMFAFRSKQTCIKNAQRRGIDSFELAVIE